MMSFQDWNAKSEQEQAVVNRASERARGARAPKQSKRNSWEKGARIPPPERRPLNCTAFPVEGKCRGDGERAAFLSCYRAPIWWNTMHYCIETLNRRKIPSRDCTCVVSSVRGLLMPSGQSSVFKLKKLKSSPSILKIWFWIRLAFLFCYFGLYGTPDLINFTSANSVLGYHVFLNLCGHKYQVQEYYCSWNKCVGLSPSP